MNAGFAFDLSGKKFSVSGVRHVGSGRFEFKFAELAFSEKCLVGDWKKVTDLR